MVAVVAAQLAHTAVQRARQRARALLEQLPVQATTGAGESSAPVHAGCGVHRASVVDDDDPNQLRRLQVVVPGVHREPVWALPCMSPGHRVSPAVGDVVWVTFEQGDVNVPVWLGVLPSRQVDPQD
jgi:hypothetical protein